MGLIRFASDVVGSGLGALGGTANSAIFKEYFVSGDMSDGILMKRGERVTTDKSKNTRTDNNLISSGSGIDVQAGQCMIIVDNGRIVEFCTEPGRYKYDSSTQPSLLSGENKGLKALGKEILNQWSAGGQRFSTQRVYFINMGELLYTPIKWGCGDIAFHHTTLMRNGAPPIELDVTLKGNGEATIIISDPMKFFEKLGAQKVGGDNDGVIKITDDGINSNLRSNIVDRIADAISEIGFENAIPYTALSAGKNKDLIRDKINNLLSAEWAGERGFEIASFSVNGAFLPTEEDKDMLQQMQQSFTMGANMNAAIYDIQKGYSEGARAAGSNENGAVHGFMGMGMAGSMGGFGASMGSMQPTAPNPDYTRNPYQQNVPVHEPIRQAETVDAQNKWVCECGCENTGNFCMQCGAKKVVPQPTENKNWVCPCGTENIGNFCMQCGTPKSIATKVLKCDKCGWTAPKDVNSAKFCPICGDPVTEEDYQ